MQKKLNLTYKENRNFVIVPENKFAVAIVAALKSVVIDDVEFGYILA